MTLELAEFSALYQLSKTKDLAIYELTHILIKHAEVNKSILLNLCADYDEIARIGQFADYLNNDKGLCQNLRKMNALTYRDYGISAELVSLFR